MNGTAARLRRRATLLLALAAPVWGFSRAQAKPVEFAGMEDRWRHYQSPNFELYSCGGDGESREFLHDLELLQAVFTERLGLVEREHLDVTSFYFGRRDDFRAYIAPDMNQGVSGFYLEGLDRATIVAAPEMETTEERHVVFHEFIHHLFRATGEHPTTWYDEGTAELLSSLKVDGKQVELGWPQPGRLLPLQNEKLLGLDTLFSVDHRSKIYLSEEHAGIFYAESWALLHYWFFGHSDLSRAAVTRFVRVASDPDAMKKVNLAAYFHDCFGMDYQKMQRRLERYVVSGRFGVGRLPLPEIPAASTYAERSVPPEEIRLRLAELALRTRDSARARLALLDAAEAKPVDARVLEVLGSAAEDAGDKAAAQRHWESALAAGSQNVAVVRALALLESEPWFQNFDYDLTLSDAMVAHLRSWFLASIRHDPDEVSAYEALAWVEAYARKPNFGNVDRVQRRFGELIHRQRTVVALALVRARLGLKADAKGVLAQLAKLPPDPWSEYAADIIRAKLDGRSTADIHMHTGREETRVLSAKQRMELPYPSVVLPDAL